MPTRIFDDITTDRPVNVYAGLPVQEVKALNADMSTQYNQSKTAKDALDVMANNLDLRDVDYETKKRVIDETRAKFKDLTERGDYQNAQYLIQGVTKDLATDNQLQGAIQSRQKELSYYKGLKDQLDKGEITQDIYNFAIEKSRAANKLKTEYDPNTLSVKNLFSGQGVTKDLSKEIYDNMNTRIQGWMPESITSIDGQQYKKTINSPTGYFNVTTGKQVTENEVYGALRTELENTGEYRDFLNQEKAIDFHKQFKQSDGTYRDIDKSDIGKLGLSDNKIKTILSGVSQDELDRLSKSKDKKDQETYQKYTELRGSVNPDNLTKEELTKLYNYAYTKNQSDKYVAPATAKADYQLFDDEYLADTFGLENLKHRHRLAEDKAKAELTIKAAPENTSQLQQYRYADILAQQQTLADVAKETQQLQAQYPNATEATKKEIEQRLQVLANKSKILQANNSSFEDDMSKRGYDVNMAYGKYLFQTKDSELRNKLIDSILALPANKINSNLSANLQMIRKGSPNSMGLDELMKELNSNPEVKKIYNNIKNDVNSRLSNLATQVKKPNLGDVETTRHNNKIIELEALQNELNTKKEKFLESEKVKSISTQFISIDESNNNKESDEGKTSNKINREVRDLVQSQVQNPSSEFTTENGTSIYDIASGDVEGYKLKNAKGESAKADLTKTKVNLTSQTIGGKVPVGVTFYDTDGNALFFDDEQKGQATVLAYPKNDDVTVSSLKRIGKNYLEHGATNTDKIKGIQYLGNTEYKTQLDNQIAPEFWTDKPKGYAEDVTLNIKGQPVQLKVIKANTGSGQTEFSIAPIDGSAKAFYNIDGKPISTFKTLEQAATVLFFNENYNEVAPYLK